MNTRLAGQERDEVVEKFRAVIGNLLNEDDLKDEKWKQRKQKITPVRVMYARDFLLRCAMSPYSTLPPSNMPQIVLDMDDIIAKFPRRFVHKP